MPKGFGYVKDRTGVKDALTDTSEKSQKAENVDAKTKNGNDANEKKTVLRDEEDEVIPLGYASSNKKDEIPSKEDIEKVRLLSVMKSPERSG